MKRVKFIFVSFATMELLALLLKAAKGDTGALLATSSEIAPETPTTSYQSRVLSLPDRDDGEISSVAAITSCKAEEPAQPGVCRSDLSGAVLLLSAHLAQPEPASPEQDTPSIVKKQRPAFVNGNYCRYYGYRLAAGETEDPRLQVNMEGRAHVPRNMGYSTDLAHIPYLPDCAGDGEALVCE